VRITERALILPALYFINRTPNITTTELITELTAVFRPSGEDAEILEGRNDTKFSQKVRNLVSHHTLDGTANYTKITDGCHTITPQGRAYLKHNFHLIEYLLANNFAYVDVMKALQLLGTSADDEKKLLAYDEDMAVMEGKRTTVAAVVRVRSKALRDLAIQHYTSANKLACTVCGFDFYETYQELGQGFIEIHHLKPLCQYETDDTAQFLKNALKNVAPVCANCHRMLHRSGTTPLSIEQLKNIIHGR
jgi:predicted HNH restriction endonuclease